MKTNMESASSEIESTIKKTVKKTIVHRKINANYKSPIRIQNENSGKSLYCVSIEDAYRCVELAGNYHALNFYQANKAWLPIAENKINELAPYSLNNSVQDLIDDFKKTITEFIKVMEELQTPILCVEESVVVQACSLEQVRMEVFLTNKYWQDLPSGKELLVDADNRFEELCSQLKIGRRTRSIMKNKKIGLQQSNESLISNTNTQC